MFPRGQDLGGAGPVSREQPGPTPLAARVRGHLVVVGERRLLRGRRLVLEDDGPAPLHGHRPVELATEDFALLGLEAEAA